MTQVWQWANGDYVARSEPMTIRETRDEYNLGFFGGLLVIVLGFALFALRYEKLAMGIMIVGTFITFFFGALREIFPICHPALKIKLIKGKVDGRTYEICLAQYEIKVCKNPEVLAERMNPIIKSMSKKVEKDLAERMITAEATACILEAEQNAIRKLEILDKMSETIKKF